MEYLTYTYCRSAFCQHPFCWEAQRKESRGILQPIDPVPICRTEYHALPKQHIVNLFEKLDEEWLNTQSASQPTLSKRKSHDRSSHAYSASWKNRLNASSLVTCTTAHSQPQHDVASDVVSDVTGDSDNGSLFETNVKTVRTSHSSRGFNDKTREKADKTTPSNKFPGTVARHIEIHEVFDRGDLESKWHDTFGSTNCYVWLPSDSSKKRSGSLTAHESDKKERSMVVKNLTEGLIMNENCRPSATVRSRKCLKSPCFVQDRLKCRERPKQSARASDSVRAFKANTSVSVRKLQVPEIINLSEEFVAIYGLNKSADEELGRNEGTRIEAMNVDDWIAKNLPEMRKNEGTKNETNADISSAADERAERMSKSSPEATSNSKTGDIKNKSGLRELFVSKKTIEDFLPPLVTESDSVPVGKPIYAASATSTTRVPQAPVTTPTTPSHPSRPLGLRSRLPTGLSLAESVESESITTSSNVTQQRLPSIKTICFTSSVEPSVRQGFTKRFIDISIPLPTTEPIPKGHSRQKGEEAGALEPGSPPPSPEAELNQTGSRHAGQNTARSDLEETVNDVIVNDVTDADADVSDENAGNVNEAPSFVAHSKPNLDDAHGQVQSEDPVNVDSVNDVTRLSTLSVSVQSQNSNTVFQADECGVKNIQEPETPASEVQNNASTTADAK